MHPVAAVCRPRVTFPCASRKNRGGGAAASTPAALETVSKIPDGAGAGTSVGDWHPEERSRQERGVTVVAGAPDVF